MNYVQKFDSGLFSAQGAFSGAGESFSVDVHPRSNAPGQGGPDTIVVPDAHLLFSGDYKRSGLDLVLSKDGHEFVARDYFRGESRAALASPDGASLSGNTVEALAGQVDYAQAGGAVVPGKIIGQVTKLTGSATAIRNGVSITLNVGDNVHKGDVVQSGSDSALGITFIDGTVFGLSSNARMVLNEMIYDPAGSSNASLLTLVQGTISFVAGATAKHGDMKVETPTATMGIRGTAVLVEIDFDILQPGLAPPVSFRILVEPNGETGEYVLLDKLTRQPIATVNQPGTKTVVDGQGSVTFFQSAEIPANAQRLINEIFTLKFTDANPKFIGIPPLDTITPQTFLVRLPDGTPIDQIPIIRIALVFEPVAAPAPSGGNTRFHLNIPPDLVASSNHFTERLLTTGNAALDTVSGIIHFDDINPEDRPTVTAQFNSFVYRDAQQEVIITSSLTLEQLAAIQAVQVPLSVVQHAGNTNVGDGTWTYSVADHALDFLAEGETLTLIYMARVDTNYIEYNTVVFTPFKITITGTNDLPTAAATGSGIIELDGTNNPDIDHAEGVITFADVDLTDRPTVTAPFANYAYTAANGSPLTLTSAQEAALAAALTLTPAQGNTNNGSVAWSYDVPDNNFDFIAAGETLVLTYNATVDDGHGGIVIVPLTLTVSVDGTNDIPTITATSDGFIELVGTTNNSTTDQASGTITFTDVDLTDHPAISAPFSGYTYTAANGTTPLTLTPAQLSALAIALTLTPSQTNANNGSVTWSYDLADNQFDFLAVGETLVLTYTATVNDGHGGIVTTPITVTVTGTNDVPVINVIAQQDLDEQTDTSPLTATIPVTFTDVDLTDVGHTAQITHAVASGVTTGLALNEAALVGLMTVGNVTKNSGSSAGSLSLGFAAASTAFDYLAVGEVLTLTYTVAIDDHDGGTTPQTFVVTVTGTNDAPVIDAIAQQGLIEQADTNALTATIQVTFTDVDLTDVGHTATVTQAVPSGTTTGLALNEAALIALVTPSTVTKNSGSSVGSLSLGFAAASTVFDYLAVGEVLTLTYTVVIDDHDGGTTPQTFVVTITGTNDAPTIAATNDAFTELAGTNNATFDHAGGTITFTDVDLTDRPTVSSHFTSFTYQDALHNDVTSTLTAQQEAAIAAVEALLALTPGGANANNGSVVWSYDLADSSFDFVADGETLALTYTATVDDGHGGSVSTPITVTVHGTNDAPTIAATNDTFTELAGTNNATLDHAGGTITFTDVDLTDRPTVSSHFTSFTYHDALNNNVTSTLTAQQQASIAAVEALLALTPDGANANNGSVTWSYDLADSSFDFLAANETLALTYTATVDDGHGGSVSTPITVTITGTNDAPVAVADVGLPDVPLLDAGFETPGIVDYVYGPTGGAWTFVGRSGLTDNATAFTNGNPAAPEGGQVAFLQYSGGTTGEISQTFTAVAGAYVLEFDAARRGNTDDDPSFQVVVDGVVQATVETPDTTYTHHSVAVQIANDGPHTISLVSQLGGDSDETTFLDNIALTGANTDFNGSVATNDFDIDAGAVLTYTLDSPVAGLTLNPDGSYAVDHSDPAYAYLAQGEQLAVVAGYKVTDEHGAFDQSTLTVTVTGTNDAPLFTGDDLSPTYTASGSPLPIVNNVSASDIDSVDYAGGSLTATVTAGGNEGDTLSIEHSQYIELSGTTVLYDADGNGQGDPVAIGTLTNYDYNSLTVTLNGTADDTAVAKLTQAIEFSNSKPNPVAGERTVTFTLQDGGGIANGGQDSAFFTTTVTVAASGQTPQALGGEFRVNTTTANAQTYSAIGSLSDGGFLIAWVSAGQDGSGTGVYAQRYDSSGATVGNEFRVNTATADDQSSPYIASLADGSIVVSWVSGGNNAATVHAQLYNSAGAAVGSEFTVATGENSTIAALANGGFVVTYVSTDGDTGGTFAALYDANGTAVGSPFLVNTTTVSQQQGDSVAATADGGFIVSWHSYGQDMSNTWGIYFQRFDASGNKLGAESRANIDTVAGDQYGGELAVLKDGTFVVSWIDQPTNSLVIRHFDATGNALGSEVVISNATSDTVQALPDGGYFVTYVSEDGAGSLGLYGQRIDASDAFVGSAFLINQTTAGDQSFLADRANPTAVLASGTIASTWFGAPDIDGSEIYARLFSVAPQLISQTFLGGAGDQGAADVSYANGHLYLAYNTRPELQSTADNSTVVSFTTVADAAPTQDFSELWTNGFFNGIAADGTNIYAVGASHPGAGLTVDGIGGTEVKTLLATFNADGTPGSNPAPAIGHAANSFFPGYQGVELFQDVVVTTHGIYAVGHGQPPAASGAYVIASYDSSGNLLHSATDPLAPGFSIARDVIEFNGQIWAVGYTEHSGDTVGRAVAWAANYDLSSVATYKDTAETAAGDFSGAAVIGSNLYAVGYVNSNSGDYLVAKYNTDGSVAWSHSFGGTGADYLNAAVALNGHLYVVGYTTDGSGNTDGVLMEISTVDGSVISTTSYGGALYDSFNSITTDGQYLYIAGESKSFAGGGNVAGQSDAFLLTYDPSGGPVIDTEHFTTSSTGNNTSTTVTGLLVADANASETLTLSATTAQATAFGSTITPSSGSGDLSEINTAIGSVVYDPGLQPPSTDMITFTVSGASGSDTVNFVFIQAGPGNTLVGTSGKDVIFGTEDNDTLTGGGGQDQFVFSDTSSGSVQHAITDFETTLDRLDLRQFSAIDALTDVTVTQQGSDTLVTLDSNDTILLQNVQAANLHASNFLFHA